MIGTIDIKCNAAHPNMPLPPVFTFIDSPSSFRVIDVPKKIGNWKITEVSIQVEYPDAQIIHKVCTLVGGAYVATIDGSGLSGKTANGFTVYANGIDENGDATTGYVLGKGDIVVLNADSEIAPETRAFNVHFFDEFPEVPKDGDMVFDDGLFKIFSKGKWKDEEQFIEDAIPLSVSEFVNDEEYQTRDDLTAYAAEKTQTESDISAISAVSYDVYESANAIDTIYLKNKSETNISAYESQKIAIPDSLGGDRCRSFAVNISGEFESGIKWLVENYVFDSAKDDPLTSNLSAGAYRFSFKEIDDGKWYIDKIRLADGTYIMPHDEIEVRLVGHDGTKKAVVYNLQSGTGYVTLDGIQFTTDSIVSLEAKPRCLLSSITGNAFFRNNNLEEVSVYDDIDIVGSVTGVFYSCPNLKSVKFKNLKTTTIGTQRELYSFLVLCPRLSSVEFDEAEHFNGSFAGCSALQDVTLPKAKFFEQTFRDCKSLSTLDLPNATEISAAFYDCESLSNVSMPQLEKFDFASFSGTAVSSLNFPEVTEVKGIYNSYITSAKCKDVKIISLPKVQNNFPVALNSVTPNVEEIRLDSLTATSQSQMVAYCQHLKTLYIPNLTSNIYFYNITALTGLTADAHTGMYDTINYLTNLQNASLSSLTATTEITALAPLTNLTSLYVDNAVMQSRSQQNIYDSVESPLQDTIYWASKAMSWYSNYSLATIDKRAFENCTQLQLVEAPEASACLDLGFSNCTSLEQLYLQNLSATGPSAFNNCTGLTSVYLPSFIACGANCFKDCTALIDVNFPELTAAGASAFNNCTGLTSVYMPKILRCGGYTFSGCTQLSSVELPMLSSSSSYMFANSTGLVNMTIGGDLTTGMARTFHSCPNLESVTFSGIHKGSFTVETFYNCPNLKHIYMPSLTAVTTVRTTAFDAGITGLSVHVPASLVSQFQTATNWSALYAGGQVDFIAIGG